MATNREMKEYREKLKKIPPQVKNIPFDTLSSEECLNLVKTSSYCLPHIPKEKRTRKICISAIKREPRVLQYVPEEYKDIDLYIACYEGVIEKGYYGWGEKIAGEMPKEFHAHKKIIELERKLDIRKVKIKRYQEGKFEVIETLYNGEIVRNIFCNFKDFYSFIDEDLSGANLLEYDFKGICLDNIDVSNALIRAEILKANDLYDDAYYKTNIKIPKENIELVPYEPQEITSTHYFTNEKLSDDVRKIYYISDLHLNHKLGIEFLEGATENEVKYYVKMLVDKLMPLESGVSENDFIMIAGDTSYNFRIAEMFYTELVKRICRYRKQIIVVLGNHELWNLGTREKNKYNLYHVIKKYRKLFEKLGIIFLQNDLLIISGNNMYNNTYEIITENEILSNSKEWLREKSINSKLTVFGGIGFSGENDNFNALNGIYKNTITSLENEKKYTKEFNNVYNKVKEAMGTAQVVVLTHTPIEDWNTEGPISNWIYVNGHTHINHFSFEGGSRIYADNQSGYKSKSMTFKSFELSEHYDIFHYYEDGSYDISVEEYINFYRGIGKAIQTNSIATGQIIMLKRYGLYFFLYKENNGKLYYLEGGHKRKLKCQNVEYYYHAMPIYQNEMKNIMKNYYKSLKFLSEQIKKIGGNGRIHGCIIDIDYYNHIFLEPSGEIRVYWAESICRRKEYSSIEMLLKAKREDLYCKFLESKNELQIFSQNKLLIQGEQDAIEVINDTCMYARSNLLKKMQYMFDVNVIREWNEEKVERIIFNNLNPESDVSITIL